MHTVPTTTIKVLRGTTVNAYDDEEDSTAVVYKNIAASISETGQFIQTMPDGTPRVIRQFSARISAKVILQDNDRIKDERTGEIYIIDNVTKSQNPVFTPERRVNLRRVGDTNN